MKIAVTSQGKHITCDMDARFGRARCFVVMDTETGKHTVVDNGQHLNAQQGAGVQAAQVLADLKVDAVITGHCGPKAFRVLEAAGIKVYVGLEGSVRQAVDKLTSGELTEADSPNVEGHW